MHSPQLLQYPGTLEPRNPGTLEPWNPGTLEPWNPGTLEPWNPETLKPWNPGTLEPAPWPCDEGTHPCGHELMQLDEVEDLPTPAGMQE